MREQRLQASGRSFPRLANENACYSRAMLPALRATSSCSPACKWRALTKNLNSPDGRVGTLQGWRTLMTTAALEAKVTPYFDWADLLGRIGLALLFIWSGYTKFAYTAANVAYMKAYGMPLAEVLIWPAALIELVAAAMLVLGWKARWAALALAAYTVIAALIFHAYWSVPADQ